VIGSDRVYLGLLAGAPIVLGGVILAIPAKYGLGPAPGPAPPPQHHGASPSPHPSTGLASAHATAHASAHATTHASAHASATATAIAHAAHGALPATNDAASSLLLILVICACFAGAFNAVRELVKERAIYGRERAAGLSTASYLGSKLAVLGFISGLQAAVMVLIGLFGRKLPTSGSLVHGFPLAELIIALALLAVVSMALGLFISASVNTSEKTMPILMVVVVVEVILTGGVFAIAGKAGLEQVAWLSPSRWGYALTASTSNLNKIFPPGPGNPIDHLWDHTPRQWVINMIALAALGVVFASLAWWRLVRQGPARRG
jgi:ABC transport system ATP-binding/permease protein